MRKEKKYHFLYKTTNIKNGKYYIGMHSTDDLNDGYLGSGKRLRYSINKYGKGSHILEILEFVESREELKSREKEVVNLNEISKNECMNLMIGGKGGFISDKQQKYRSVCGGKAFALKLKNDLEFREKHIKWFKNITKEAREMGKWKPYNWEGRKHTEETKNKMSKIKKGMGVGENNSQFGTCWIYNEKLKENKKIELNELDKYLKGGWNKGRKMKY